MNAGSSAFLVVNSIPELFRCLDVRHDLERGVNGGNRLAG